MKAWPIPARVDGTVLAGAPFADPDGATDAGIAYRFAVTGDILVLRYSDLDERAPLHVAFKSSDTPAPRGMMRPPAGGASGPRRSAGIRGGAPAPPSPGLPRGTAREPG